MGFKVILTPQSLDDLEDIVRFIAKDNSDRAVTFGNELINRALSTENFPERGRNVPEINEPSVREIIHGAYRISTKSSPTRTRSMSCVSGTAREVNLKSNAHEGSG